MDEFNQAAQDFNKQYEIVQQAIQQNSTQKFDQLMRRLDNCFNAMKSLQVSIRGPEKSKAQQIFIQKTRQYQELQQQVQQRTLTSPSSQLGNDPQVSAYQKAKVINNYLDDAKRNADETTYTGYVIIDNLKRQNKQMQGIITTNQNIQSNAEKSRETIKIIEKKEKMVNIIFYVVSVILLASNGLAFWVFHHNVKKTQ